MYAVRFFVYNEVKTWYKHFLLTYAMRSAVNKHAGYTTNELMMDHDVNKSATLRFNLIEGGGGVSDAYIRGLAR